MEWHVLCIQICPSEYQRSFVDGVQAVQHFCSPRLTRCGEIEHCSQSSIQVYPSCRLLIPHFSSEHHETHLRQSKWPFDAYGTVRQRGRFKGFAAKSSHIHVARRKLVDFCSLQVDSEVVGPGGLVENVLEEDTQPMRDVARLSLYILFYPRTSR